MSDRSEPQQLLDDVLAESAPADFRAAALNGVLRQVRRRRRWRHARHAAGGLAVLLLATIMAWQHPAKKIIAPLPVASGPAPKNFQLVETQPFPAAAIVSSQNFAEIPTVSTAPGIAEVTAAASLHFINDTQLLALLAGHPAALVRTGPNSEELVFANPDDSLLIFGNK